LQLLFDKGKLIAGFSNFLVELLPVPKVLRELIPRAGKAFCCIW
jgi:hypothetical protein